MIQETKQQDTEIVSEKQQEKKNQLLGNIRPHRGHTLYKVNVKTLEVTEAVFEKQDIEWAIATSSKKQAKKILIEKGCIYISALNEKNAVKKFPKFGLKAK